LLSLLSLSLSQASSPHLKDGLTEQVQQLESTYHNERGSDITMEPVIGILSQTLVDWMKNDSRYAVYESFIASTFVEFVISAGGRVVPIILNDTVETNIAKLRQLNGFLLPGGDGEYYEMGEVLYKEAMKINDEGTYFPVWGTCMGYEYMSCYSSTEGKNLLEHYPMYTSSIPLKFTVDPRDTQMYGWLQDDAYLFEDHNLTWNGHNWGVDPTKFETDPILKEMYTVTAVGQQFPPDNRYFVASIESKKYPFFGVQFHPEEQYTDWSDGMGTNHSWMSIMLNRQFADVFLFKARHCPNVYRNFGTDNIENYERIGMQFLFN